MILSLPLHPLLVHGAVALIPAAALLGLLFVLRPGWRWALRLPTAVTAVVALGVLFVTRETGDALAHATTDHRDLVERHDQFAGLLTAATIPMVALALFACWSFASPTSPLASGAGRRASRMTHLATPASALLVLLCLACLVLTVLTGHSGAAAAWAA